MTNPVDPEKDSKEKFRQALEKKLANGKSGPNSGNEKMKIKGSQSGGVGQRMFRRKSGSS